MGSMNATPRRVTSAAVVAIAILHFVFGALYWFAQNRPALATVSTLITVGVGAVAIVSFSRDRFAVLALGMALASLLLLLTYGV